MHYRTKLETDYVFLEKIAKLLDEAEQAEITLLDKIQINLGYLSGESNASAGGHSFPRARLKNNDYSKKSCQITRIEFRVPGLHASPEHQVTFRMDTHMSYRTVQLVFNRNDLQERDKTLIFLKLVEEIFPPLKLSPLVDKSTESLLSDLHAVRDSISTESTRSLATLSDAITRVHRESIERIDDHIRKRDDHFRDLEDQLRLKNEAEQRRMAEIEAALSEKEASLNLKEPIGERRRIHTDLRTRLIEQISSFKPSNSVNRSRIFVRIANIALIGLSIYSFVHFAQHVPAGVDAVAQNASVSNPSANFFSPAYLLVYIKMTLSAAAAFGFSLAYIRWEGRVADRLSETEFNIRDKAIDIERSAWIVETVEAMTSGGKEMPEGLIQLLGHNLFVNGSQKDSEAEQLSSFLQHLVGKKGSFETHIPGGGSVTMKADGARPKSE